MEASQGYIHSDTMWAAIANYWALLGSAGGISFQEFLQSFRLCDESDGVPGDVSPLFIISSAFPFTPKGTENCYWLPKPLSVPFSLSLENNESSRVGERSQYGKSFKTVRFISRECFSRWQRFTDPVGFEVEKESYDAADINEVRPQVAIDRVSGRANIFHSGISYLDPSGERDGLYLLLRTADQRVVKALDEVLGVISETGGIGGDISSGCGTLRNHYIDPVTKNDNAWACLNGCNGANASCLLSLCLPATPEAIAGSLVAFNTVLRKGWTGSLTANLQRKRKTLFMLSEGTVMTGKEAGCLSTVTPELRMTPEWHGRHEVYRYGYAFAVPIRINIED
jgi:CRISPR-associated protein Csm4